MASNAKGSRPRLDEFLIPYIETALRKLSGDDAISFTKQDEPQIDARLCWCSQEVLVEIATYNEQGPALRMEEKIGKLRTAFSKAVQNDVVITAHSLSFYFKPKAFGDGDGYALPNWDKDTVQLQALMGELRVLIGMIDKNVGSLDVQFRSLDECKRLSLSRYGTCGITYVDEATFPILAKLFERVDVSWANGAYMSCPHFNSDTRFFGFDGMELCKVIQDKHGKVTKYRAEAQVSPVWLVVASSFSPTSGIVSHMKKQVIEIIQKVCISSEPRFDAVIWIDEPTTSSPTFTLCDAHGYDCAALGPINKEDFRSLALVNPRT